MVGSTGKDVRSGKKDVRFVRNDVRSGKRDVGFAGKDVGSGEKEVRFTGKDVGSGKRDVRFAGKDVGSGKKDVGFTKSKDGSVFFMCRFVRNFSNLRIYPSVSPVARTLQRSPFMKLMSSSAPTTGATRSCEGKGVDHGVV